MTKPPKVYNLSDLVPPSFYIPIDNKDYSSQYQFRPSTYQSYLVRKHRIKPNSYIQQVEVITIPPEPFDYGDHYTDSYTDTYTDHGVYDTYGDHDDVDIWELNEDSDWKIHWIRK